MVERGEMTVREAGKKGGDAIKKKYGSEFFSKIGKKGGKSLRSRVAVEDPSFYVRIGKAGGDAVKEKHDPAYFSRLGQMGAQAKWER